MSGRFYEFFAKMNYRIARKINVRSSSLKYSLDFCFTVKMHLKYTENKIALVEQRGLVCLDCSPDVWLVCACVNISLLRSLLKQTL
jgi:hypothetical protein